jgi:L-2-hydroxyglutarate oxidase LhgO
MNDQTATIEETATSTMTRPQPSVSDGSWDVAIVGGGIVGLAVAREILRRRPGTRLVVLEKEDEIAQHQTGHNSGVIHAGIYYTPGSMKAKLCVAGAEEMKRYCDEKGIPWRRCGKLIVATDESELPRLESLHERGLANNVPGLELVEAERVHEIEPHVRAIRALWSPNTGIVDYGQVAHAYAEDIQEFGGEIRTRHEALGFAYRNGRTLVETSAATIEAKRVVTCAGVYSDRVARLTGASPEPRIVPFRGDYYILNPKRRDLVRTNIYPVPDPRFPFLGVHFTPRMNGDIWLGPNAVLAFSREGYRFRDIRPKDVGELFTNGGFRRFARQHWRTGMEEMARDLSRKRFLASLQKFIPELTLDDLLPGPAGVRAQALSADGGLVDDFVIDRSEGVLHVRNAPSPAATSSLRIGALIADAVEEMR